MTHAQNESLVANAIAEQNAAVDAIVNGKQDVAIVAAAGSGKTRIVVNAVLDLLRKKKVPAEKIVLVTFSAAGKSTIRNRLQEAGVSKQASNRISQTFAALSVECMKAHAKTNWHTLDYEGYDVGKRRKFYYCIDFVPYISKALWSQAIRAVSSKAEYEKLNLTLPDDPDADPGEDEKDALEKAIRQMQQAWTLCYADGVDPGSEEGKHKLSNYGLKSDEHRSVKRYQQLVHDHKMWSFDDVLLTWSRELHESYDYVIVDEAQDCSKLQLEVAKGLARNGRLILVGDPRQCVHEWRGSAPWIFANFVAAPTTDVVDMTHGWRSDPRITTEGNLIAKHLRLRAKPSVSVNKPADGPCTLFRQEGLTDLFSVVQGTTKLGDQVAVLARKWSHLRSFEEELLLAGIPFTMNKKAYKQEHCRKLEPPPWMSWPEHLTNLLKTSGAAQKGGEKIRFLVSLARNFASYEEFLSKTNWYWNESKHNQPTVVLSTIHSTKGLEFETVMLVMEDWLDPDDDRVDWQAEFRLLYVAVTRAVSLLLVYDPSYRYRNLVKNTNR